MFYYKFTAETPYCGTECEDYQSFEVRPSDYELDEIAECLCRDNAEGYEYLVSGWDDENFEGMTEEEQEEEINNYYADCYGGWVEISKEEYEENT
jgi:hypothetical protein